MSDIEQDSCEQVMQVYQDCYGNNPNEQLSTGIFWNPACICLPACLQPGNPVC